MSTLAPPNPFPVVDFLKSGEETSPSLAIPKVLGTLSGGEVLTLAVPEDIFAAKSCHRSQARQCVELITKERFAKSSTSRVCIILRNETTTCAGSRGEDLESWGGKIWSVAPRISSHRVGALKIYLMNEVRRRQVAPTRGASVQMTRREVLRNPTETVVVRCLSSRYAPESSLPVMIRVIGSLDSGLAGSRIGIVQHPTRPGGGMMDANDPRLFENTALAHRFL
ncbi:hypothetical protein F4778DRAFT_753744 [Xylariomycetidae sp. FL2044]|nr:hypothetical protein F4778DRAFT_753744 [Xylariomycetidae sp. FL2044]